MKNKFIQIKIETVLLVNISYLKPEGFNKSCSPIMREFNASSFKTKMSSLENWPRGVETIQFRHVETRDFDEQVAFVRNVFSRNRENETKTIKISFLTFRRIFVFYSTALDPVSFLNVVTRIHLKSSVCIRSLNYLK